MAEEHKDEGLWTTQQVTGFLQVDEETVYRWVREGRLKRVKVGSRNRSRPEDIRAIRDRGLPTEGAA
jgi:excisionase family DNA binding protein